MSNEKMRDLKELGLDPNHTLNKILVVLVKHARVSEDETPLACVERLIEEATELRKQVAELQGKGLELAYWKPLANGLRKRWEFMVQSGDSSEGLHALQQAHTPETVDSAVRLLFKEYGGDFVKMFSNVVGALLLKLRSARNEVFEMTKSRDDWEYMFRMAIAYQGVLTESIVELLEIPSGGERDDKFKNRARRAIDQGTGKKLHDAIQLRVSKGHSESCCHIVSGDEGNCNCGHQDMIDALNQA